MTDPPAPRESLAASSSFLRACRGEPVASTPVWLMRQAGRFQAEYRAIREKVGFLELCKTPDLAAEVTVFAVRQLGVDAGIIFADILLVLEPMGLRVTFEKGDGPVIHDPIVGARDVDRVTGEIDAASLGYVGDAIRGFKRELPRVPLIGFAGAPFTLASYAIEGGGSKNYVATKRLMYEDPGAFSALMERLSVAITRFLSMQIDAGADAVQLFDSWAGALSPRDYRAHVAPHMKRIVDALPDGVPVITFGTGTGGFLEELAASGADVVGVDWRLDLADAARRLPGVTLQGNLDPVTLFGPVSAMKPAVEAILAAARGHRGHVFNLGHGILPGTPVDHVRALVELVHELSAR
ncbi:MAG: uroporphyrinogen decarboxylase [Polyangiaceae bacterium]|nr:uroporphyrinogen decarboxylase [Polyangiaceae bacterium]